MNKKSIMIKFHLAQTSTQCATIITFIVQQSLCVNLMVWDNILCWNAFTSLQGKCFPSMLFFAWGSWGLPYGTQSHRHIISRKSPQGYHAKWAFIKCHILLFSTNHWTASLHLNTSKRVQAGPQREFFFFKYIKIEGHMKIHWNLWWTTTPMSDHLSLRNPFSESDHFFSLFFSCSWIPHSDYPSLKTTSA